MAVVETVAAAMLDMGFPFGITTTVVCLSIAHSCLPGVRFVLVFLFVSVSVVGATIIFFVGGVVGGIVEPLTQLG